MPNAAKAIGNKAPSPWPAAQQSHNQHGRQEEKEKSSFHFTAR
jgi:hypothetical protein